MKPVTISPKYQVVIHPQIQDRFDLKPGQKLVIIRYQNTLRIVIVPPIEAAEGIFKGIDTDPNREKEDSAQ
jgi:AbrB family looped-hinge helix DNA binding protein